MSKYHQPPHQFIQAITLNIHDQKTMVEFYTWLGFKIFHQDEKHTVLGTQTPLLTLQHDQSYQIEHQPTQGLYHVAYLLPDRVALGSVLNHLIKTRYPLQGLSDHGVSEAIYLADPEGNGIEFYVDRPKELWPYQGNQLTMVTNVMNYQAVLTLAKPFAGFPQNTILGHLHLHVANLKLATEYYQQTLGYDLIQHYGDSAAFLSTAGYHHHLGINTWQGLNPDKKNPLTTGLIGYQIHGATSKQFFDIAGLRVLIQS